MVGMNSLAPELIRIIFKLVEGENRIKTLLNLALVCGFWTESAQEEVWRTIEFRDGNSLRMNQFVISQATLRGMKRTFRLAVGHCASNEQLRSVVSSCRGIKVLQLGPLRGGGKIDVVALFQLEALEGMHYNSVGSRWKTANRDLHEMPQILLRSPCQTFHSPRSTPLRPSTFISGIS